MNFVKRTGFVMAAVLALGTVQAANAGTIQSIALSVDPAHDLQADLFQGVTITSNTFNFIGSTPGGTFVLTGTYDTGTNVADGTFTANGQELSPSSDTVSYSGTILSMDMSGYLTSNTLSFLVDQPTGPDVYVFVDLGNELADVSPVASSVPTPAAAMGGTALLGLLGMTAARRKKI
jgi:hypothetical protein